MNSEDVLQALERLDAAGVEWWIDGGWGVDALLGEETRPHADLDVVVLRDDVARLPAIFPEFQRAEQDWWPARFVLRDESGRQLDFHPVEFDQSGDAWQELVDGRRERYPAAGLTGRGRIGARDVRCITSELQLAHHEYATGSPDDVDWADVRALCERFGLPVPPAYSLRPGFVDAKRNRSLPDSSERERHERDHGGDGECPGAPPDT